jgi:hypothetical protein
VRTLALATRPTRFIPSVIMHGCSLTYVLFFSLFGRYTQPYLVQTDTLTCNISTASLIGPYLEACKLDTAEDPEGLIPDNDPVAEMKSMHPSHTFHLRRSVRLIDKAAMNEAVPPAPAPQRKRQRSRKEESTAIPSGKRVCRDPKGVPDRWIRDGELVLPKESWTYGFLLIGMY